MPTQHEHTIVVFPSSVDIHVLYYLCTLYFVDILTPDIASACLNSSNNMITVVWTMVSFELKFAYMA